MKAAIFDIDDTIVEETKFMLKNAKSFLKNEFNLDVEIVNPNGYDVREVYALVEHLKSIGYSEEQAIEQSNKINQAFWNANFVNYCRQPLKPGAKETIELLKQKGYRIMFVSLRGKATSKKATIVDKDNPLTNSKDRKMFNDFGKNNNYYRD